MFDLIKQQVSLIKEIEKDLGVTLRPLGEKNWKIDGDKDEEACPFCGHHDCFSVKYEEGDNAGSFYKCFSCGEAGDVVDWRAKRKNIKPFDAAKELAKEAGIRTPGNFNPVQQVFDLAAAYYHNCLVETCDKPYPVLNGLTPIRYQTEVRRHKLDTLTRFKIGYSDGGLLDYLDALGIDRQIVEKSGLISIKEGKPARDFLPASCFIYPHYVKGQVSHFTFKDPLKKIQYQLPKKYSLNGYLFYGQQTFSNEGVLYLVEGENDWLSVMESGGVSSAMAIIGQISSEQVEWLRTHAKNRRIITLFDPDDAGDKYRKKLEAVKRSFGGIAHVRPPDDKDIDDHLTAGGVLNDIIRQNVVQVSLEEKKRPEAEIEDALWKDLSPVNPLPVVTMPTSPASVENLGTHLSGPEPVVQESLHRIPTEFSDGSLQPEESGVSSIEEAKIVQKNGQYYKVRTNKDGINELVRLSDFTIEMLNVYEDESGERFREIVIVKSDGRRSKPFRVDSETKVTVKLFRILVAKFSDCEWLGRDAELDGVWRLVYNKFPDVTIAIASKIGRYEKENCWIFKNLLVTGSGVVIAPDENGVFWPNGRSRGIKPDSISTTNEYEGMPELHVGLTREETKALLGDALNGITKVIRDPGAALMAVGWIQSNIYSNEIFKANGGMGSLMFWGAAGKGKSTLAKWLQRFYGLQEKMASTSVQQLKSGVGFMRKAEYYSSLPMFLDELRADELSGNYLGMIRSWYDREGRTTADMYDRKKIHNQKINATLIIGGEDLPEDPATKERCIMVRVPPPVNAKDPDYQKNYDFMEEASQKFSNISYFWIIDSCSQDKDEILKEIRRLDVRMVENGCSNRISKVWAGAAYFAMKLCEEYFPDYDFLAYLIKTSAVEHAQQKNDNTLARFLEMLENLQGRLNTPITDDHVARDSKDPDLINIWYPAVFAEVMASIHNPRERFSKHAILRTIREEPYYVSDDRKVNMGLKQQRRTVLTLDLMKCPDSVKNLVGFTK